jgi:hypothetical protein
MINASKQLWRLKSTISKGGIISVIRLVKESLGQNDISKIRRIIDYLVQDFAFSSQSNARNGGLIGLAAVAIALGVLSCLNSLNVHV